MSLVRRSSRLLAGLALGLAALLAGCSREANPGVTPTMTTGALPPIDLAAPQRFETATFALG